MSDPQKPWQRHQEKTSPDEAAWGKVSTTIVILIGLVFFGICIGGLVPSG